MPLEPPASFSTYARKYLLIVWRGLRCSALRILRLSHYGIYKAFIRNERVSRQMLAPTLNGDDLKFLVIGGLLLMATLSILYWTKVIGIHR